VFKKGEKENEEGVAKRKRNEEWQI